jgi:hypothetical protein
VLKSCVARRERDDEVTVGGGKCVRHHYKAAARSSCQRRDRTFDLAAGVHRAVLASIEKDDAAASIEGK